MQRAEGIAGAPHDATTPPAVAPGHGRRAAEPSPAHGTGLTLKIPLLSPKKPPHTSKRHLDPQKATSSPQKSHLAAVLSRTRLHAPNRLLLGLVSSHQFFKKIALKT